MEYHDESRTENKPIKNLCTVKGIVRVICRCFQFLRLFTAEWHDEYITNCSEVDGNIHLLIKGTIEAFTWRD